MARDLYVRVIGDSRQYERTLQRSAAKTHNFNRELSRMGRGALSGSGAFKNLGRSLAFASGGFVAFESIGTFIRDSIDAARDAAVAQRSLAAQMKASGESFITNRQRIDQTAESYAKFGFQNDEVIASLTVLERGTGKINEAIRLQGLAADIARARNIELAQAATVVAKVFGGQETALRRAVPGLRKNAHGLDLIRLAQARLAGQAAAGATVSERFAATLHDTEEILGKALLPILNKYLGRLSDYLDQLNRSGKLAQDVNQLAGAIDTLAGAIGVLHDAEGKFETGRNFLQRQFGKLGGVLTGSAFSQLKGITKAYNNMVDAWQRALGRTKDGKITDQGMVRAGGGPDLGHAGATAEVAVKAVRHRLKDITATPWLSFELAVAESTKSTVDDLRILQSMIVVLTARLAHAKSLKDRTAILTTINQWRGEEQAITDAIKQSNEEAAKARKEAAKARRERLAAAKDARQFRQLGLGATGDPLTPGVALLKRRLAAIRKDLAGTALGRKDAGLLGRVSDILFGGNPSAAVRAKINDIFDTIRQALSQGQGDISKWAHVANRTLIDGLGLTPEQRRELSQRLATVGPGGTVPPRHTAAFAGQGGMVITNSTLHFHGVTDIGAMENQLTKRQAARHHNRRGAH
jgi:hypothetical protein